MARPSRARSTTAWSRDSKGAGAETAPLLSRLFVLLALLRCVRGSKSLFKKSAVHS